MFSKRFLVVRVGLSLQDALPPGVPASRKPNLRLCHPASSVPLKSLKPKSRIHRVSSFVDFKRVKVFGGNGGNGSISFLQIFCNPFAGPDGGDGGCGGHVIFRADANLKSLQNVNGLYQATSGGNGRGKDMHGASAGHTFVDVPIGTVVKDEGGKILEDLDVPGVNFVAARGGSGGKGNAFYLSNTNRHPRVAEIGAKGEERVYLLELKILAHVGLVGFPNAGKSTLLRAISRARPKVASYPFTTLQPHIGIVHYDDYVQIAVADLPGLIPDAHKNRGLGFSFLKHIERCVCLLYIIDLSHENPYAQLKALQYELEQFQPGLSCRPAAIVGNKIDLPKSSANLEELRANVTDIPVFAISAKKGNNVLDLLKFVRILYNEHNKDKLEW